MLPFSTHYQNHFSSALLRPKILYDSFIHFVRFFLDYYSFISTPSHRRTVKSCHAVKLSPTRHWRGTILYTHQYSATAKEYTRARVFVRKRECASNPHDSCLSTGLGDIPRAAAVPCLCSSRLCKLHNRRQHRPSSQPH